MKYNTNIRDLVSILKFYTLYYFFTSMASHNIMKKFLSNSDTDDSFSETVSDELLNLDFLNSKNQAWAYVSVCKYIKYKLPKRFYSLEPY